jgi:NAD(P)-dependent dehydrogenase (short-subunit alcohol dehydrogenase family)
MQVEGSTCIVTGGGSGIGRALAEEFAAAGARVVVGDIAAKAAGETADRIRARGHVAVAGIADASSTTGIRTLINLADVEFGAVDIYVANAGVIGPPGLGLGEGDWDRTIAVNLSAHVRAAALLVPDWIRADGGYFVSVASAAGLLTHIGGAAYTATKHAAVGFAEWLAITYGDLGIGVSCVCPMGVDTTLLNSTCQSLDATEQLAGQAIVNAAPVISPEQVAHSTLDACRRGDFLVLPHPEVRWKYQRKCEDHNRWIAGMQRYQAWLSTRRR